jgi:hypothetical protein
MAARDSARVSAEGRVRPCSKGERMAQVTCGRANPPIMDPTGRRAEYTWVL